MRKIFLEKERQNMACRRMFLDKYCGFEKTTEHETILHTFEYQIDIADLKRRQSIRRSPVTFQGLAEHQPRESQFLRTR
jgi:hypothetical protein